MSDPLDNPPADHGSDRYDYVEIIGAPPDVQPSGAWWDKLLQEPCPDCRANVFVYWRTDEQVAQGAEAGAPSSRWSYTIAHDETCPTENLP